MIGERLEEARKRKSVSIREAAEATKIRGDYLISMEDNSFDIPLPQIYIRGFLKNYARFLKLDPNKILTDYDAHLLGRTPAAAGRISEETLGRVELKTRKGEDDEDSDSMEQAVVVTEAPEDDGPDPELSFNLEGEKAPAGAGTPPPPTLERDATRHDQESWNENKTLYMKIGVVFAGILLVSIILIVLIQLLSGGDKPEINPDLAGTQPSEQVQEPAQAVEAGPSEGTIVIAASDNVTLIVEQTLDRRRLFSGSLNEGETISLDREGPVSIRFTNGSAITIQKGNQTVRPGQAGVGRTVVE